MIVVEKTRQTVSSNYYRFSVKRSIVKNTDYRPRGLNSSIYHISLYFVIFRVERRNF